MNKHGKIIVELLIFMIVVVLISAVILSLVKSGLITPRDQSEQVNVLNTEFLPLGRSGSLVIKDFSFCGSVDNNFNCISKKNNFELGSEVHFNFIVESSTYNGDIIVVENYRVKGPNGNILLDVEEKNNFNFNVVSRNEKELINFKDFFIVGLNEEPGTYTLELVLNNPLITKKTNVVKTFVMEE